MRSQEIPGVTGKFGLGVQTDAGQRLTGFCQENTLVIANNTRDGYIHGHHHQMMVITKIRLIIFFAAKDGEALIQLTKKQDLELTVAQIIDILLQNSDLN